MNIKENMNINNQAIKQMFIVISMITIIMCFGLLPKSFAAGETSGTYVSIPPFLAASANKPNVIISLDTSGSMKLPAYAQSGVNWQNGLHNNFDPTFTYYGFFDPEKFYKYDTDPAKLFFVESGSKPSTKPADSWDGNFLNWMTMRRFDVTRRVLIGGKIRDRATEYIGGQHWYVILGQNEPQDRQFSKTFPTSSAYTPSTFADGTVFKMSNGQIDPLSTTTTNVNFTATSLQDKNNESVEMGIATMDWSIGPPEDPWMQITFENTYSTAPAVVAKTLTYNGGDETVVRVRNVTTTGFELRMQEWDYKDGNHTTEDIFYLVADKGNYELEVEVPDGSGGTDDIDIEINAGSAAAITALCDHPGLGVNSRQTIVYPSTFDEDPVIFTGVSTFNEADAVTVRNDSLGRSSVEVCMQEQEDKAQASPIDPHAAEDIHYIAMAPESGESFPIAGVTDDTGAEIEVGKKNNVDERWHTINFTSTFSSAPMFVIDMQEIAGTDTASLRVANAIWSTTQIDVQVDEEKSNDNEVSHADEDLGYIATVANGQFNIHLGIPESDPTNKPNEPIGLVQKLGASMNLGMAVFNYDHTRSPTSVYNGDGKAFDGGTFDACYPDVSLPAADRTNWDICKELYVGAPIDNLIDVIEDHPLVWATTPIAETLYNIGQYVAQGQAPSPYTDLNGNPWPNDEVRQGSPTAPATHNGNAVPAANVGAHPLYKVNNTWDPYYVDSLAQKVPCSKTFVLHFNDGAPYTDWDNSNGFPIPGDITAISGYTTGNAFDDNDGLDEVAHRFRNQDLRSDLTGHQEIISYYILAALGEDMSAVGNTPLNRLMRAAAMGGFNDKNNDNEPDNKSVTDFVDYINTNSGVCATNEWDEDGNCVPDTFYFANDGFALEAELLAAFESILKRVSSGGSASVLSGTASGQGAIFEARFEQERATTSHSATWIGDVSGTFIDSYGRLREDGDQDDELSETDFSKDGIISMCEDPDNQVVRVHVASALADLPTATEYAACQSAKYNKSLFDIKRIWSAAEEMSALSDANVTSQRAYTNATGRYIFTAIDGSGTSTAIDGVVNSDDAKPFTIDTFSSGTVSREELLYAADGAEATKIIDFTRGKTQSGAGSLRERKVLNSNGNLITWRLGDIIHSSPLSVGRPAENYDLIYGNNANFSTYASFFQAYKDRRTVVYAGGNDGMMHAFNGGYFNPLTLQYEKGKASNTQYKLGAELWGYIPYNALPHLKYVADPSYGSQDGDHISLVDGEPRVFDARIFNDGSITGGVDGQSGVSHPGGWGTILVGGMRFGGGPVEVDTNGDGTVDQTLSSSFFILDITDPEAAPKLLLEYSHADLGFTTATPTPIVKNNGSGVDNWYLLLGSGPHSSSAPQTALQNGTSDQPAKLFMFNLKTMQLESDFGTSGILTMNNASDASNAFVSGMYPVDYDLDTQTDAVYISTTNGTSGNFNGKLYRLTLRASDGSGAINSGSYRAITAWTSDIMVEETGVTGSETEIGPITSISNVGIDDNGNRWVYFGTGRFLVRSDASDNSPQSFYGIKEPRDNNGGFTWASPDTTKVVDVSDITVKTDGNLYKGASTSSVGTFTSSFGSATNYVSLKSAMLQRNNGTLVSNAGWKRDFGENPRTDYERNVGQAVLIGGVLAYTAFEPSGDVCKYEGSSSLYAVSFLTGTASASNYVFGDPDTSSGAAEIVDSIFLGSGLTSTLSLHVGSGYTQQNKLANSTVTGIAQSSKALLFQQTMETEGAVISGETNWRIAK